MERRDLIKDEIERLGKALGKILSDLLSLKAEGKTSEGIDQTQEALKAELELDIEIPELVKLPENQFLANITARKNMSFQQLEQLGDLFFIWGEEKADMGYQDEALLYLRKSRAIYEHITEESATYSFEREEKVKKIDALLN